MVMMMMMMVYFPFQKFVSRGLFVVVFVYESIQYSTVLSADSVGLWDGRNNVDVAVCGRVCAADGNRLALS